MRERCRNSPLKGDSPIGGQNERFCLRRKFGCRPRGRWTRASQLTGNGFLPKLFLFPRMGIALLPVAAGVSLSLAEVTLPKTNLPEGILRAERATKWLLEAVEDCIFQKKGGFGGVWFGLVSVKNVLDYHAH